MSIQLPQLPYAYDSLEPYISKETLTLHHDKHHATYVTNANNLSVNTEFENKDLEYIIKNAKGGLFNNAAQVYNHTFYWNSLTPNRAEPTDGLRSKINEYFGSLDGFKNSFIESGKAQFGSGWTWLVQNQDGSLEIMNTSNADTPMTHSKTALLVCDVWEHAYYVDYQNRRADYLENFWSIVNWDFVAKNLK